VALLRILLAEHHGNRPDFYAGEPRPENLTAELEAMLVIGDRCFAFDRYVNKNGVDSFHSYDLAELWEKMTGRPFVFAAWALGKSFAGRATPSEKSDLIHLLTQARDRGLANLDAIAAREAAAGRLGPGGETSAAGIRMYFRDCLQYVLSEKEMAGLQLFYELCLKHAIFPAGQAPTIAAAGKGE
jgi:chorismate dehydratase